MAVPFRRRAALALRSIARILLADEHWPFTTL
jgi:hypothetical protein